MMYEVKVSYTRQTGEDNPGKFKETYLAESVNCSGAEQRVMNEIAPFVFGGDVEAPQIRKRLFFDIFPDGGENWYEAKVEMIVVGGDHESRKPVTMLIQADTIDGAVEELHYKHLTGYDHEVISVKKSAIIEVLKEE